MRPVIYYLKHLLQDMDEEKMLSRALISYVLSSAEQLIWMGSCFDFLSFPKVGRSLVDS